MTEDRYLWDGGEPVDDEVQRLEQTLRPLRFTPRPLAYPLPWRRFAIAAVAALAVGLWWLVPGSEPDGFPVQAVTGTATIDGNPIGAGARLSVGSWLESAASTAIEVRIADIGIITVHGETRLGLLESLEGSVQRLQLDRGRIEALITAPPRLFLVNTPSAVAVDLGCQYELEVDEAGNGLLEVTLGWVALERGSSVVTVPADASARLYGDGPGVPWFNDAPPELIEALDRFEIQTVLARSRPRDSLTLWHLLERVDDASRPAVIARLDDLVGMPPGVTAAGVARLDRSMLDLWWNDIELDW
jgi:hypothetical protein